jgi:hypothetical protein
MLHQPEENASFISLLKQREELGYYLNDENRVNFQAAVSVSQEDMVENMKCLYTIPYSKLNM